MAEHISNERLAALLDDAVDDDAARDHLASCPGCRRELDLLRRMRMALSAMDELQPPAGQWDHIASGLPATGAGSSASRRPAGAGGGRRVGGNGARGLPGIRVRDVGWLRIAAGVVLFAGGLGLGSVLGPWSGPGPDGGAAAAGSEGPASGATDRPVAAAATGEPTAAAAGSEAGSTAARTPAAQLATGIEGQGTEEILRQLEALGSGDPDPREAYRDPTAAAQRLARLDALVRAAREALEEDPADPAMNQFLFRVVEERQRLNQALHLASLDYR